MNSQSGYWRRPSLPALILAGVLLMAALAACQSESTQSAAMPAAVQEPAAAQEQATVAPVPVEEAAAAQTDAQDAAAGLQTFQIVPDGTEARFYINEVLLGQDKTVIGVTSDVTGELRVHAQNPGSAEIGPITINARDLTTDSDRRNSAIRRFILQSERDEFQYIVFAPVSIEGLPAAVTVGEPFQFQVTGNLTVRDVTKPVTFAMAVTATSQTELSGLGSATVSYRDFALNIPEVPSITGVEDEVRLELEFRAAAQ